MPVLISEREREFLLLDIFIFLTNLPEISYIFKRSTFSSKEILK